MRRPSRYRVLSVILVALGMLAITVAPAAASHQGTPDRDCSDFSTQAAAQDYFEAHGGPSQDPDQLDADGDGLACVISPR